VDSISNKNHQPQPKNLAFPNWPWPQGDASGWVLGWGLKPSTKLIELPFWQLTAALDGTPLALAHDPAALRSPMPAPCLLVLAAAWWHWVGWLGCHGRWNMWLRAHSQECQGENWLVSCGNGIGPQHPSPLEAGLLRNDCLAHVIKPCCHLIRI
jgi:hypothetical protein